MTSTYTLRVSKFYFTPSVSHARPRNQTLVCHNNYFQQTLACRKYTIVLLHNLARSCAHLLNNKAESARAREYAAITMQVIDHAVSSVIATNID